MRFTRILPAVRPLLALVALAVAARPAAAQHQFVFRDDLPRYTRPMRAPAEYVKQAVKVVFEQLEVPLQQSARDSAELFTPAQLVHQRQLFGHQIGDFFACMESHMSGNVADHGRVTYAVLVRIHPTNEGVTRLEMQVEGLATRMAFVSTWSNPVDCRSTGLLEKSVADAVEQLLSETAPPPE